MTRAETLLALAARVEAGTGPDRELDREIHFHAVHPWLAKTCVKWVEAYCEADGSFLWWTSERLAEKKEGYSDQWLPFTTSLDAATSLVPAGCDWLRRRDLLTLRMVMRVVCNDYGGESDAPTPARALTAAALRARAAEAGNGE